MHKNHVVKRRPIKQLTRNLLISITFTALIGCGNKTVESPQPAPITVQAPQSASATQVSETSSAKAESSPEDAQFKLGEKVFRKCKACHTIDEGARHRVGPNLYGVMGAHIASKDGFPYSKASKASDVIWTDENLDAFLKKPRDFLPGNRMTFVGLKKEDERKAVIAYLHKVTK